MKKVANTITTVEYVSEDVDEVGAEVNYTQELRDAFGYLNAAWNKFTYLCHRGEVGSTLIHGDTTLDARDREKLSDTIDAVTGGLKELADNCIETMADIQGALDAFGNLQLTE